MRIPFQIQDNNKEVLGVMHITSQQFDIPKMLIMCYGLDGNRVEQHRMSIKLGESCEKMNMNLVRFDYANVGVSEGEFVESTLQERIRNTIKVCEFVEGCFNGNVEIYLVGFSDGAKIASHVTEHINVIKGLIMWNPIINLDNDNIYTTSVNREKLILHPMTRKPSKQLFGLAMNLQMVRELAKDNTAELLKKQDVLFIFGENDRFTLNVRKFIEKVIVESTSSELVLVKNAGHVFTDIDSEKIVIHRTLEWICKSEKV